MTAATAGRRILVMCAHPDDADGHLYYPEQVAAGLGPHRVREILLMMGDHVDDVVDIGPTVERKVAAGRAQASQWGQHPDLDGFVRRRAAAVGAAHGLALAEAFKRLVQE